MTTQHRLRVLVFAMRCAFSALPLEALHAAGHEIVAVIVPGWSGSAPLVRLTSTRQANPLPIAGTRSQSPLEQLVRTYGLPFYMAGNLGHPSVEQDIASWDVDAIAVACFPRRIPATLVRQARLGGVNVHPSLLPRWRGAEPLFWTYHAGDTITGVTIHRLTNELDGGPILAQEAMSIEPDERLPEVEHRLALRGGALLVQTLAELAKGDAVPLIQSGSPTRAPQPTADDFVIPADWTADHAYRFARGVSPLGGPLAVVDPRTGGVVRVADALEIIPVDQAVPPDLEGTTVLPFAGGWVRFRKPD